MVGYKEKRETEGEFAFHVWLLGIGWLNRHRDWRAAVLFDRRGEDLLELIPRDRFNLEQARGYCVEAVAVLHQNGLRLLVGVIHQAANFLIDLHRYRFGIIALFGDLAPEEDQFLFLPVDHRAELGAHPQAGDHGAAPCE